jgi:hypothetical protein
MKNHIIKIALATIAGTGLLFAQGLNPPGGDWHHFTSPYDPKTPPPLGLAEAYNLALKFLGPATNRFYCVSTSCMDKGGSGFPGWTFWLSSTNGQRAYVEVSFDKEVGADSKTLEILRSK